MAQNPAAVWSNSLGARSFSVSGAIEAFSDRSATDAFASALKSTAPAMPFALIWSTHSVTTDITSSRSFNKNGTAWSLPAAIIRCD